jgi:GntR family transcriptional regulator
MSGQPSPTALLPEFTVDRRLPVPFHFQLSEILQQEIVSGRWSPGDRLSSEPQMARRFQVSRATIRQALQRLEQEGLITRSKGRGTFVAELSTRSWLLQSEGFFQDEVVREGRLITSTVLSSGVTALPSWASRALDLDVGSAGVTLERLRFADELVALYVVNHLPEALADTVAEVQQSGGSLYERLARKHGLRVAGARRVVEAVSAGERLGALLEVAPGTPLAFIESVSWDREMRPFDCYRAWLRTDRIKLEVEVASSMIPGPEGAIRYPEGSPDDTMG